MVLSKKPAKAAFLLFFLSIFQSAAQEFIIKGKVFDAGTREPLAFVNIMANPGPQGTSTDIDGKFLLRSGQAVKSLKISYVGYLPTEHAVDPSLREQTIYLQKKELELSEVVIKPGINPANRIIRKVLENRPINDHERMNSFYYSTYEKITFGPENDSIRLPDSLKTDTTALNMKAFFERQYLFLMESVTERSFMYPDKNYNKVIASRVSGFSDPLFVFLMSQLQSTSFYKEVIRISDKDYINPISSGTLNKYYFEIRDTLIEPYPYDTTYIMTFRPLMKTNFEGLKGVISISTNSFAIRNVIAQPARPTGTITIKIQQLYDFVQNERWFPVQLNTDIIFQGAIGKGTVSIGIGSGTGDTTRQDLVGRGKSYIKDISLNPEFRRSKFGFVEVDVQQDAYRKTEEAWNLYRNDSLTLREANTYQVLDSIGKANDFDKLGYKLDAVLNGKIPVGPVDLELDKLFRINKQEAFRVGVGIHTNDRFSSLVQLGGYVAYGFGDKMFKYGGNTDLVLDRFRDTRLRIAVDYDMNEAGADDPFEESRNLLDASQFRQMLVNRMDQATRQKISLGSRIAKYAHVETSFSRSDVLPLYDYRYLTHQSGNIDIYSSGFRFSEASLMIRYAYGEKFIRNTRSVISLGTSYPVVWLSATRGVSGFGGGEYDYFCVKFKVHKTLSFKYAGKTSFTLLGGWIDKDVPYPVLFNAMSSYGAFSLYSPNSFATMRMNEFVADRFVALFASHNFGKLLYRSKYFNPQPELITNIGIGKLSNEENHLGIDIRSYEKGFAESGLLINNILNLGLSNVGFGVFYRYGPYSFPHWKDNLAVKLAVGFALL